MSFSPHFRESTIRRQCSKTYWHLWRLTEPRSQNLIKCYDFQIYINRRFIWKHFFYIIRIESIWETRDRHRIYITWVSFYKFSYHLVVGEYAWRDDIHDFDGYYGNESSCVPLLIQLRSRLEYVFWWKNTDVMWINISSSSSSICAIIHVRLSCVPENT